MERFSIVRYVGFAKTRFLNIFLTRGNVCRRAGGGRTLLTSAALKDQKLRDQAAMNYAVSSCNALIERYVQFRETLKSYRFSYLASLDDANWIYPLIYAAEDSGIQTVGIQHGIYCDRHPAYVMKGIQNHRWFDELLVWGDYWRDKILSGNSFPFPSHCHVASNKHSYDASPQERTAERPGILIPFEFLADTNAIGKFIDGLIDAGFNIFLKTRSDFDVSDQLASYCLGERGSDIILVQDITAEIMANVDVAGSNQH